MGVKNISIGDLDLKFKIREIEFYSVLEEGIHKIPTNGMFDGNQYLIQIETDTGFYNKVYEYLE